MILLVDNYDSFSHNLYQLIGSIDPDVRVVRNDAVDARAVRALAPSHVVLSPGPGRPAEAGSCEDIARELSGEVPLLGVCLGHQAICEAFGATVGYARRLMHGKRSTVELDRTCALFARLPAHVEAGRYHSLAVDGDTLPPALRTVACTRDGEVMAVAHERHPTFGLQFHPESILTCGGDAMMRAFLELAPPARWTSPNAHEPLGRRRSAQRSER